MDHYEGDGEGQPADDILEATEYDALMGKSVQEILQEGQKALFARLVGRVRLGKASHQEAAILRNLLKDNGLTLGIPPEKAAPAVREEAPLPDFPDPED